MPKSTKKTTQRKAKAAPAQATPAPVKEEAVSAPAETESTEPSLNDSFNQLMADFTAVRTTLTSLTSRLRVLQKRSDRELRAAQKASQKRRRKTGNARRLASSSRPSSARNSPPSSRSRREPKWRALKSPAKSTPTSANTRSRTPKNGRRILPDAKLRKLLNVAKSDELTYFNLRDI